MPLLISAARASLVRGFDMPSPSRRRLDVSTELRDYRPPEIPASSSASSSVTTPTSSAIFSMMLSIDSSAVLDPPRDARVGVTWSSSSKVVPCMIGTRRLRRRSALSSLLAMLRSVPSFSSIAGVTRTIPMRELTSPLSIAARMSVPGRRLTSLNQTDRSRSSISS